ncbi:MAG: hypothetical protein H6R14_2320 [Proteobacteria bacterium]|nr:hypothetical protein [Pseudomonadota bacterium]
MSERRPRWFGLLAGALLGALAAGASAGEACRIAFDMGSSGIRAGQAGQAAVPQADIDYLGPLTAGRGLAETLPPTVAALRDLPARGGFAGDCARLGGGFSAWRLAANENRGRLADDLRAVREASGVAVLVIPQRQEGAYGYLGARQLLGERLATSHILDIGGGSLQVAGERASFGALFGQKLWHRELCLKLRNSTQLPCALAPLSPDELATARAFLRQRLAEGGIAQALPEPVAMTAISRPVTRGVGPAVARFFNRPAGIDHLSLPMLRATIELNAGYGRDEMAARLGSEPRFAAYLLSDLLLVEGLMEATGGAELRIAELDLTNLPGLLADEQAYRWVAKHDCYLGRLRRQGVSAYHSDPASCPARAPR